MPLQPIVILPKFILGESQVVVGMNDESFDTLAKYLIHNEKPRFTARIFDPIDNIIDFNISGLVINLGYDQMELFDIVWVDAPPTNFNPLIKSIRKFLDEFYDVK